MNVLLKEVLTKRNSAGDECVPAFPSPSLTHFTYCKLRANLITEHTIPFLKFSHLFAAITTAKTLLNTKEN